MVNRLIRGDMGIIIGSVQLRGRDIRGMIVSMDMKRWRIRNRRWIFKLLGMRGIAKI